MMVIPRENKYVRLYIQVTEADENGEAVHTPNNSNMKFSITKVFFRSTASRSLRRTWPKQRIRFSIRISSPTNIAIGGQRIVLDNGWARNSVQTSVSSSLGMRFTRIAPRQVKA